MAPIPDTHSKRMGPAKVATIETWTPKDATPKRTPIEKRLKLGGRRARSRFLRGPLSIRIRNRDRASNPALLTSPHVVSCNTSEPIMLEVAKPTTSVTATYPTQNNSTEVTTHLPVLFRASSGSSFICRSSWARPRRFFGRKGTKSPSGLVHSARINSRTVTSKSRTPAEKSSNGVTLPSPFVAPWRRGSQAGASRSESAARQGVRGPRRGGDTSPGSPAYSQRDGP